MTKRHSVNFFITYSLAFCSALTLTACSFSDASYIFKSSEEKQAIMHKSPGFWDDTTAVSGSSNLSILHNVAFEGHPYNNIRAFGDNILMVGQGNYNSSLIEAEGQTTTEYSFDVYDPWANEITASLDHSKTQCDDYLIKGDELWLIDSSSGKATIYDSKLNEKGTRKYDPESDSTENIVSKDTKSSENAISSAYNPGNYYNAEQVCSSSDNRYALVSGISPDTYKYELSSIDLKSQKTLSSFEGQNYSSISQVDSHGFLVQTDFANNIWNYHSNNGENHFFQMADIIDTTTTADGSILFRQQKNPGDTSGDEQYITYYKYSPDSGVTSSFSYDLGAYGSEDFKFCSADSVYLSDANCMMLLLYTAQCNPEILIWSLDDGKNDTGINLAVYDNDEVLIQALRNDGIYISPYDAQDSDYGADITMIPDTSDYDWGNLTEINAEATALEQQYGFSIYLGKEVPEKIDYYSIKQETDADALENAMSAIKTALDCYPDGFFDQLCYGDIRGLHIYLSGSISSDSDDMINEASGFVNVINNYAVMVLDCNYSWDWSYTVAHEMSHLIDQRLDFIHSCNENSLFSENKWLSFNPDSFKYDDTYSHYNPDDSSNWQTRYFIDSYGTTYATEDRAEIFGTAIDDYINGINDDSRFAADMPIREKLQYYSKCIRDGFDTSGWSDVMPWETVLQSQ